MIDITEEKNDLKVLVNPELVESSEETKPWEEGCLSLPGIYDKVTRPAKVKVKAQDLEGNFLNWNATGCWLSVFSTKWIIWKGRSS